MTAQTTTRRNGITLWHQGHRAGVAGIPASQIDIDYERGYEAGRRKRKMTLWTLANLAPKPHNGDSAQIEA